MNLNLSVAYKHMLPPLAFAENAALDRLQEILKEFNVQAGITNNAVRLSSFILLKKKPSLTCLRVKAKI